MGRFKNTFPFGMKMLDGFDVGAQSDLDGPTNSNSISGCTYKLSNN